VLSPGTCLWSSLLLLLLLLLDSREAYYVYREQARSQRSRYYIIMPMLTAPPDCHCNPAQKKMDEI